MLCTLLNPSNAEATLVHNYKDTKVFENHLNHVGIHRIAFGEYYQMSTQVPGFQSFFSGLLRHFVFAKLASSSIRIKCGNDVTRPGCVSSIQLFTPVRHFCYANYLISVPHSKTGTQLSMCTALLTIYSRKFRPPLRIWATIIIVQNDIRKIYR